MSDLIDVKEAAKLTGMSEQTINRSTRNGAFPKPTLVDSTTKKGRKKAKRWKQAEITGWMMNNGIDNKANGKAQAEDASFMGMVEEMDTDVQTFLQKADAWYEKNKFTKVPFIVAVIIGLVWAVL